MQIQHGEECDDGNQIVTDACLSELNTSASHFVSDYILNVISVYFAVETSNYKLAMFFSAEKRKNIFHSTPLDLALMWCSLLSKRLSLIFY